MQFTVFSRSIVRVTLVATFGLVSAVSEAAPNAGHATYQIVAEEMCCQGCAKKVAAQLYTAPGVINVKADVAKRTVTVTAKPSPKLTLEKLWKAVDQAKGGPSRLSTAEAVYTLTRPDQLHPELRPADGVYTVYVADMHDMKQAERVARQLRSIGGIESVSVDLAQGAFVVKPTAKVELSPWALIAAVGQAHESALTVTGSYGRLSIEPVTQQASRAVLSPR